MRCKCSSICFPLIVLLDRPLENIEDDLRMDLIKWAHDVSWFNFCLFHLQQLGALKTGSCTVFLTRHEILRYLDELSTISVGSYDKIGTTIPSNDSGSTYSAEIYDGFCFADLYASP